MAGDPKESAALDGEVPLPTSENEAALMVLLGHLWLKQNAPHRLTPEGLLATPAAPAPLSEEEPWHGHRFKEHPGGVWRCECGHTLYAAPAPLSEEVWRKRYETLKVAYDRLRNRPIQIVATDPPAPAPLSEDDFAYDVQRQRAYNAAIIRAEAAERERDEALEALRDMREGWRYIRTHHGDLYGVGWDRAQEKADALLAKHKGGGDDRG